MFVALSVRCNTHSSQRRNEHAASAGQVNAITLCGTVAMWHSSYVAQQLCAGIASAAQRDGVLTA